MPRIIRDDVSQFFENDISIPTSTIYMGSKNGSDDSESGVDYKLAENVIKGLHLLDQRNENPITIIMNNVGGDWHHGMAIFDAIMACQNDVIIKVLGQSMSMASVVLQAGHERVMSENSRLMLHYGSTGHDATHALTFQKFAEEAKRLDKLMEDIYLGRIKEKHPKYSREKLKQLLNFDTYLSSHEAVALGLADRIG